MGLDSVELVMAVEERFGIAIDDAEAAQIATPGQLIDCVVRKVGYTDHAQCLTQRAFHRLRVSLMRQFGFKRERIRPDTPLTELFPRQTRRKQLAMLLGDLKITKVVELVRPGWLRKSMATLILAGGSVVWFFLALRPTASASPLYVLATTAPLGMAVFFMIAWGWLLFILTRKMKLELSPNLQTIGHLSRWILAHGPDVDNSPPGEWSREKVAVAVRQIVIEQLGCEKDYREDARFVKDLGMD